MCRHQLLPPNIETGNASLTKVLRIKRGTILARYFQLYNAFFVSAVIHHIESLNCPYSASDWYQFYFFMIKPLAIKVDGFAIYLGRRTGLKDSCAFTYFGALNARQSD